MEQLRQHQVVLRGERVLLRPLTEEDWSTLLKWNRDPEVLYFVEVDEVSERSLEEVQQLYRSVCRDAFCFMIEVQGRPVGECWLQRMILERVKNGNASAAPWIVVYRRREVEEIPSKLALTDSRP